MKRQFASAALIVLMSTSAARAADLAGAYDAAGTSAIGKPYTARVDIEAKGDTFLFTWTLEKETYSGVGILQDGVLSVGWTYNGKPGVIIYKVEKDRLVGRWSIVDGDGKIFVETLTKR